MFFGIDFVVLILFAAAVFYYMYTKHNWEEVADSKSLGKKGISIYEVQQNLLEKGIKAKIKVTKNAGGDKSQPFKAAVVVAKKDYDKALTFVQAYKMR